MMTDSELELALREMSALTEHRDMSWTSSQKERSLESDDLPGFVVTVDLTEEGLSLSISEDGQAVGIVGPSDKRSPGDRARLQGLAYTLYQVARANAGTDSAARLRSAMEKRRAGH